MPVYQSKTTVQMDIDDVQVHPENDLLDYFRSV